MAAVIEQVNADGSLVVLPPQAPGGYTANVVALNSDGQSSLFLQVNPANLHLRSGGCSLAHRVPHLPDPRRRITVDVTGTATNFVDGQTVVGFGPAT